VRFNRAGEMHNRSYEDQQHRASGLNVIVAAIALWNTVYLWNRQLKTNLEQLRPLPKKAREDD
jgi:TnpA family transposase